MKRLAACATAFLGTFAALDPAFAQPVTVEDLQNALRERDRTIAALEQRVAALEGGHGATAAGTAAAAAPAPALPSAPAGSNDNRGGDEADLAAISRGLVARGVLLLPSGRVELSPSVSYGHSQDQGLVLVDTPEGISTVSDQRRRDDRLEFAATARVGLPWRSQLQIRVPYVWKRRASALGDNTEAIDHDKHLGDVELDLSHQFLVEKGALPTIIGAVGWRFPTGVDPFRARVASVASGSGTHQITGRITLLKTVDPLVLYTSVFYLANLSRREKFGLVHPGDSVAWQLGGLLAVSPDTSLSVGVSQQFRFRTTVDGRGLRGSDGVAAIAQAGVDQVLTSNTLLSVSLGVGLTRDAPDYQLMVSLPVRLR